MLGIFSTGLVSLTWVESTASHKLTITKCKELRAQVYRYASETGSLIIRHLAAYSDTSKSLIADLHGQRQFRTSLITVPNQTVDIHQQRLTDVDIHIKGSLRATQ